MVRVPAAGVRAAAVVINDVANYTVNTAHVLRDQNVGFELEGFGSRGPHTMMLVVRTQQVESPSGGFWDQVKGSGRGVLRLVDPGGDPAGPPLVAIATMLLTRAEHRWAADDIEGARSEIDASIACHPGETGKGAVPVLRTGEGDYNWQNFMAYLALAELEPENELQWFRESLALAGDSRTRCSEPSSLRSTSWRRATSSATPHT